jgi:hypothetical protein
MLLFKSISNIFIRRKTVLSKKLKQGAGIQSAFGGSRSIGTITICCTRRLAPSLLTASLSNSIADFVAQADSLPAAAREQSVISENILGLIAVTKS